MALRCSHIGRIHYTCYKHPIPEHFVAVSRNSFSQVFYQCSLLTKVGKYSWYHTNSTSSSLSSTQSLNPFNKVYHQVIHSYHEYHTALRAYFELSLFKAWSHIESAALFLLNDGPSSTRIPCSFGWHLCSPKHVSTWKRCLFMEQSWFLVLYRSSLWVHSLFLVYPYLKSIVCLGGFKCYRCRYPTGNH